MRTAPGARLSAKMSWPEIVEKIARDCGCPKDTRFKKWLRSKESVGGEYWFNSLLWRVCYHIYIKRMKANDDFFLVITGPSGKGKSTLARQICSIISPTFSMKHICYMYMEYLKLLGIAERYDSILIDEGALFSFSREAMAKETKSFVKITTLQRQHNLFQILCITNFNLLDKHMREERTDAVIYVPARGCFKYFHPTAVKKFFTVPLSKRTWSKFVADEGKWFHGRFINATPQVNDISLAAYDKNKWDNYKDSIQKAQMSLENNENKDKSLENEDLKAKSGLDNFTNRDSGVGSDE